MMESRDRDQNDAAGGGSQVRSVGEAAIRWSAIVLIVLAILYFLARYVVPLI